MPGRLVWNGRPLVGVHPHWGPVLQAHQPVATALGRKDWEGLRAYLAWQHPDLALTAQRLRDTWLLFNTGPTAGLTPVAVLMADRVGKDRLMRAAEKPLEDLEEWAAGLRHF